MNNFFLGGGTPTPETKTYSERTYKRNVHIQRRDKTADRELVERSYAEHLFKVYLYTECAYSE